MEVEIHAASHVGRIRRNNEDNFLLLNLSNSNFCKKSTGFDEVNIQSQKFKIDENGIVLAVSDGCGGALGGDEASELAVESVRNMLAGKVPNPDTLIKRLYDATLYANQQVHNLGRSAYEYNGLGSTITAVSITSNSADFVQVGDSRGYLIRKGKIYQITKDQSLVNQLIDAGEISPEEAETHHMKNVILQALGAQNDIFPDVTRLIPQRDDILLLCSDGLTNELKNDDLLQIIINNIDDLKNACRLLIQKAIEHGGRDNITAILAKLYGEDLNEATEDSVDIHKLQFNNPDSSN
jgi:PPM family protein phosphatase